MNGRIAVACATVAVVAAMALVIGCRPNDPHRPTAAEAPEYVVTYVGTPHDVVARMLELVHVGSDDVVYDLGCGDGRIVVAAARTYHCRAVGFDLDQERVKEAMASVSRSRLESLVQIVRRDIFEVDLRPATVVTLYLTPDANLRLVPQIQRMANGSRVVSHNYEIPGFTADHSEVMVSKVDGVDHTILTWKVPLEGG